MVYPEGTTSADNTVVRPRPGAFMLGAKVQPVLLRYRSLLPLSWLCEPIWAHIAALACTPFSICEVIYLPVIEGETADECGQRMAKAIDAHYLPYSNADYWWFMHGGDDIRTT